MYAVLFRLGGGDGDRDVGEEEYWQLCCISFYFYFRLPLLGAVPLLSDVVAACGLSSLLSDWYYDGAGCC